MEFSWDGGDELRVAKSRAAPLGLADYFPCACPTASALGYLVSYLRHFQEQTISPPPPYPMRHFTGPPQSRTLGAAQGPLPCRNSHLAC